MIERALEPHHKRTDNAPGKSLSESCLLDLKNKSLEKPRNFKLKLFKPLKKFAALPNINIIKSPFNKNKNRGNNHQVKSPPITLGQLYRSEIILTPSNFDNISKNSNNSEHDEKENSSFSESSSGSETDQNTVLENVKQKSSSSVDFREAFVSQTSDSLETNDSPVSGSSNTDSMQMVSETAEGEFLADAENVLFSDRKFSEKNEAQFKLFLTRLNLLVEDRLGEFV